jgi:CubicO group peptidase (beta-lactamase class C family)
VKFTPSDLLTRLGEHPVPLHGMRAALPCEVDDPVATYWPAYASRGKGDITIGHVLTHRAGVPFASGSEFGDALTMTRWDTAVRQAQGARPVGPRA